MLLIVKDPLEYSLARDIFSRSTIYPVHAVDVPAATKLLSSENDFDAILLGSDMNAVAASAFIKNSRTHIPVLMLSNPGDESMPVEGIKYVLSGALMHVGPLNGSATGMLEAINRCISGSRLRHAGALISGEIGKITYFAKNLCESILMIDRNGFIVYANQAFYDKYGYKDSDLMGFDVSKILAGADNLTKLRNLVFASNPPEGSGIELSTVTDDGRGILSMATLTPRRDSSGTIFACVILLRDITDSRFAQAELQRRILALTSPQVDVSPIDFKDMIKDSGFQELQETISSAFGVASIMVDPDGIPMDRGSNFARLCTVISGTSTVVAERCKGCISDLALRAIAYKSKAWCTCPVTGLREVALPVLVNGQPVGCWIIGQVQIGETLDLKKIEGLIREAGIPSGELKGMIIGLPLMGEYQFNQIIATYRMILDKVSCLAVQNLRQGKFIHECNLVLEELKRSEIKLEAMSFRDGLTGLYNRAFFEQELDRVDGGAFPAPISFVSVDVDGLKLINDTLGHAAGDQRIAVTGQILAGVFSDTGTVCRIGGDEFCAILPGCDEQKASRKLEQLKGAIRDHNNLVPNAIVSMSAGIATSYSGESAFNTYKRADRMMYENKLKHDDFTRSKSIDMILLGLSERDYLDHGHTKALTAIVDQMARVIGLSDEVQSDLKLLARLHDIGKIGVPDSVVMKPGALDDQEWIIMRSHVEIGANIVSHSAIVHTIAHLIRSHHERYDGTGYPAGLSGEDIPIECRILSVADAYDAMIADRPYRKGMSRETALKEIQRGAGTQFDPKMVEVFLDLARSGRI
ncbi:MAG TPA: HD domain-containing phosphohydrolase [Methanocella sp.]|nr:HD domain-containing phosphohydrolase [Methanocella sp.]